MKQKIVAFKSIMMLGIIIAVAVACAQSKKTVNSTSAIYSNLEFSMPEVQLPAIPNYTVKITDFGAVNGGQVLNSQAFADAIAAVTKKGGGKVIVPSGIWLTGPIALKSNLEIYTEPGALVIFSTDKNLYPLIQTSFEGLNTWRCISPISGLNLENVALTGKGVWDGSGDAWRFVKKGKLTEDQWKKLVKSGGIVNAGKNEWYPSEQFMKAHLAADMNVPSNLTTREEFEAIRDFLRPVMVSIVNSKKVLLDGPTFQNSPAWCIHPLMTEHLTVQNITVRNPWYSQNGDGIDIESCKNVLVLNSNFDVGDDAICIKSGKDKDGRDRGVPSENIVVQNCIVYHGHGGVTVGSEMSGGVRNLHVSNCTFIGTDVGLRFKSTRGRGGVVENIYISKIHMVNIPTQAISFDLYYGGKSVSEMLAEGDQKPQAEIMTVTEETPQFKNISISDITCKGALQAIFLQGLPEMNLENIILNNLLMEADKGLTSIDVNGLKINNMQLITKTETAVEFYNSRNIEIEGFKNELKSPKTITINGSKSANIRLFPSPLLNLEKFIIVGNEVKPGVVKF